MLVFVITAENETNKEEIKPVKEELKTFKEDMKEFGKEIKDMVSTKQKDAETEVAPDLGKSEKSKNKTAKLFEACIVSTYLASKKTDFLENARNFALNFGIAFQIHNDLKNISNLEKISEDIKNGDYSAPIIFYAQDNNLKTIKNENKLLKDIKNSSAIQKTKALITEYTNKAIENLSFIEDNLYKEALVNLCKLYTKN